MKSNDIRPNGPGDEHRLPWREEERRMRESQARSTQRREEYRKDHRSPLYFFLGFLGVLGGGITLLVEALQDTPDKALFAIAFIAVVIGMMVILDWWEKA